MSQPVIGFVGLGNIGLPMAQRLLAQAPERLWVYDVNPAACAGFAQVAPSLAELGNRCDVVCVMVRDDDQVREVLGALLGTARPGLVVAAHSTIAPETARNLAAVAAAREVHFIDAPVSGGSMGATAGTLAIMVGAEEAAFAAAAPVLNLLGSLVEHLGPPGAGTCAKLARNLIHFAAFAAVGEAQALAEAAGIDLAKLGAIVRHTDQITGGPGAIMYRATAGPLGPADPWRPIFQHVADLGEKDLSLALALAQQLGVDTSVADVARRRLAPGLGLN